MEESSRREFLRQAMGLLAGVATASASSQGFLIGRAQGANERIGVGVIGCGGMGSGHIGTLLRLRERGEPVDVVAVCDVYRPRLEGAARRAKAKAYTDYRRLLEDKDVDAVCIATPDHWHATITCEAAEAGKDVYCEKPMTLWKDLKEPKRVVETIARTRRVMQVGTQGMSDDVWDIARERVRAGDLGTLLQAQAADMRNGHWSVLCGCEKDIDPNARPGENLDWDLWLGPAPQRPWEPRRFFAFRIFWDYSGGIATDWFPHIMTPLLYTMDLTFPRRVTASGGLYHYRDGRECPDVFQMIVEYPNGPSLLLVACLANDAGMPMMIRGNKATLTFEGPGAVIRAQRQVVGEQPDQTLSRTRGASLENHWLDFLSCVRTRRKPRSHELLGYYVMTALHMGIRSYLEGKSLEFDSTREEVIG